MKKKILAECCSYINANCKIALKPQDLIFAIFVVFYLVLLMISRDWYSWSDHYFYQLFYEGIKEKGVVEAFNFYPSILGAREPIYFVLAFLSHKFISKECFDVILSLGFFLALILFLHKSRTSKIIIAFILTNIYFFAIFFVVERLKLGVLFLLLYFLFSDSKYGIFFILLAVLSHAQLLILVPFLFSLSGYKFQSGRAKLIILALLLVIAAFLYEHLARKLPIYFQNYSPVNIVKPLLFAALTYPFIEKERKNQYFCLFVPIILIALFFGESRVTLMAFFGSIYFWVTSKKRHFCTYLLFLACCYFSLKGSMFLMSGRLYGEGYGINNLSDIKNLLQLGGIF